MHILKRLPLKKSTIVFLIILLVLILDQALKIYVKLNIPYQGGFNILGFTKAKIFFIENKGMAFGMSLGGDYGKLILSLFRIVMIGFLFYLLNELQRSKQSLGLMISFGLIIAGAIGNMIDSAFYGLIFSESPYHSTQLATFMPEGGGYAPFLHGKVVDMFYFPLFETTWPSWIPKLGGTTFQFFRPVFNIADSAITVGVFSIILFHRSFFKAESKVKEESQEKSVIDDPVADQSVTEGIVPNS